MDPLNPIAFNGVGVVGVIVFVGMLVIRGHLIPGRWHRGALAEAKEAIEKAEQRADRWEQVALRALDATEQLTGPVATTAKVLAKFPNPSKDFDTNETS